MDASKQELVTDRGDFTASPVADVTSIPSPPLRILHLAWRLDASLGGVPAATIQMARAEASRGIDAIVVATQSPDASGADPAAIDLVGVRGLLFHRARRWPYSYSRSLGRWLRRHVNEYDLVEIHGIFNYPCFAAGSAARRTGTPYVVHPHGSLDPFDLRKHNSLKQVVGPLFVRPLLRGAQRVIVTAELEGDRLESYGAAVRLTTLAPPYLVEDDGADPDAFRAKYGLEGRRVILFLGRIDYKKGLDYLVDAFNNVITAFPTAVLVLCGDDRSDYATGLRDRVHRANLDPCVRFLGTLDPPEKSSALALAEVLVLVSDNENYGLVLVEAAWWGVPMLISNEVYIASLLENAGAALVVDRAGAPVASALIRLLGDVATRSKMSAAARSLAESAFAWDACASAQARLRVELAGESSRHRRSKAADIPDIAG